MVLENIKLKILWDITIQIMALLKHNEPGLALLNNPKKYLLADKSHLYI